MPRHRPTPVPQPHDSLFKYVFSQREHATGLLKAVLPPDVTAAVAWDTLALQKGSFVDRALRSRHSDLWGERSTRCWRPGRTRVGR